MRKCGACTVVVPSVLTMSLHRCVPQARYIFAPGVKRCPLLYPVLQAAVERMGHGAEVTTPTKCETLAAQGAAIWNGTQVRPRLLW